MTDGEDQADDTIDRRTPPESRRLACARERHSTQRRSGIVSPLFAVRYAGPHRRFPACASIGRDRVSEERRNRA